MYILCMGLTKVPLAHNTNLTVCFQAPSPRSKPRHEASSRSSQPNNSPPQYKLHSFSLLNYDKERLERKVQWSVCLFGLSLLHNMPFSNDSKWPGGIKLLSVFPLISQIAECRKNRRDPPSDLIHQYKEVTHRLQWQKAELERGSPALLTGSTHVSCWRLQVTVLQPLACNQYFHSPCV